MYIILWEYYVKPGRQLEFERIYSPNGAWVGLFKTSAGYAGTEFLRDTKHPQRYLTIDRWQTKADYEAFLSQHEAEYKLLDAQCEGLTESESLIGMWETI